MDNLKISKSSLVFIISGVVTFMVINALSGLFTQELNVTDDYKIQRVYEVNRGESLFSKYLIRNKFREIGFSCGNLNDEVILCSDNPKNEDQFIVGISNGTGTDSEFVALVIQKVTYKNGESICRKIPDSRKKKFIKITKMFRIILER